MLMFLDLSLSSAIVFLAKVLSNPFSNSSTNYISKSKHLCFQKIPCIYAFVALRVYFWGFHSGFIQFFYNFKCFSFLYWPLMLLLFFNCIHINNQQSKWLLIRKLRTFKQWWKCEHEYEYMNHFGFKQKLLNGNYTVDLIEFDFLKSTSFTKNNKKIDILDKLKVHYN